jgi:hypothetical protein
VPGTFEVHGFCLGGAADKGARRVKRSWEHLYPRVFEKLVSKQNGWSEAGKVEM